MGRGVQQWDVVTELSHSTGNRGMCECTIIPSSQRPTEPTYTPLLVVGRRGKGESDGRGLDALLDTKH